ncbi:MAG: quinolinate synthase NadA [Candidatus Lokiarchaeota archaeon]|nr:quinolinate synthase NadA [Candidatus Lokiarchaeota archaeon]
MELSQLQKDIVELKNQKDVTILAHYYQELGIQEIADHLGDSLGLSRIAKEKAKTKYIIFAGVLFMAETASILNQDKKILIPSLEACCPLANFLNRDIVNQYRKEYPELPVITYVNSTAEVKAESDICCTSSNSVNIVKKISKEFGVDQVLFGPDKNLAEYVEERTEINVIKIPGKGHCYVHSHLSIDDIQGVKEDHPSAQVLVHPECEKNVRDFADYIGSTAGIYSFVEEHHIDQKEFIIGTEKGLLERLTVDFPRNNFYLASDGLICEDMKKNKLETMRMLLKDLDNNRYEVKVPEDIAEKAYIPIEKMLKFSS